MFLSGVVFICLLVRSAAEERERQDKEVRDAEQRARVELEAELRRQGEHHKSQVWWVVSFL